MTTKPIALFDLGGVLVHLDQQAFASAWAELGVSPDRLQLLFASEEVEAWNSGRITEASFSTWLCNTLQPENREANALRKAWCALLAGPNPAMCKLLPKLKQAGWKCACLSNTDPWHLEHMRRTYCELQEIDTWLASCTLHELKPDSRIYTRAIAALGCQADDLFFIDDRLENVEAARACGMTAMHHEHGSKPTPELLMRLSLKPERMESR